MRPIFASVIMIWCSSATFAPLTTFFPVFSVRDVSPIVFIRNVWFPFRILKSGVSKSQFSSLPFHSNFPPCARREIAMERERRKLAFRYAGLQNSERKPNVPYKNNGRYIPHTENRKESCQRCKSCRRTPNHDNRCEDRTHYS